MVLTCDLTETKPRSMAKQPLDPCKNSQWQVWEAWVAARATSPASRAD